MRLRPCRRRGEPRPHRPPPLGGDESRPAATGSNEERVIYFVMGRRFEAGLANLIARRPCRLLKFDDDRRPGRAAIVITRCYETRPGDVSGGAGLMALGVPSQPGRATPLTIAARMPIEARAIIK